LRNDSELGSVGFDACSLLRIAISIGDPGEGGEFEGGVLERVVAELLFIDHLRVGILRWPPSFGSAMMLLESAGALSK